MSYGDPAAERAALEMTYEDVAAVWRVEDVAVGAIDKQVPKVVYENAPCALSRSGDRSKQTTAQQDVEYDCVLFLAPGLDVKPGDTVEVTRFGALYRFEAVGRPAVYATHQEVFLKERAFG